jgi:GNAT superfamily N-acetyltransferase
MAEIITVTAENVDEYGFFCKMSARKSTAWKAKRDWLLARFEEGLQLRLLGDGERGFIEFMPGAKCWRAIEDAEEFVVIHCLWVVGKSRGRGFARDLLAEADSWARGNGFRGVAALTSRDNWLIAPGVLEHHGFRRASRAGQVFELWAKADGIHDDPRISGGWTQKAEACGPGVTVLRSAQCPYLEDATAKARAAAEDLGLPFREIVLETADDVRRLSPTPYGTYALVKDGKCVSYHYLLEKDAKRALSA